MSTWIDMDKAERVWVALVPADGTRRIKVPEPSDQIMPGVWVEYDPADKPIAIAILKAYSVRINKIR